MENSRLLQFANKLVKFLDEEYEEFVIREDLVL